MSRFVSAADEERAYQLLLAEQKRQDIENKRQEIKQQQHERKQLKELNLRKDLAQWATIKKNIIEKPQTGLKLVPARYDEHAAIIAEAKQTPKLKEMISQSNDLQTRLYQLKQQIAQLEKEYDETWQNKNNLDSTINDLVNFTTAKIIDDNKKHNNNLLACDVMPEFKYSFLPDDKRIVEFRFAPCGCHMFYSPRHTYEESDCDGFSYTRTTRYTRDKFIIGRCRIHMYLELEQIFQMYFRNSFDQDEMHVVKQIEDVMDTTWDTLGEYNKILKKYTDIDLLSTDNQVAVMLSGIPTSTKMSNTPIYIDKTLQ